MLYSKKPYIPGSWLLFDSQSMADIPTHQHNYNLRPRPTERNRKFIITQAGNKQSTIKIFAKPHIHVLMMQKNVREGTILKEVNRLHICQALLHRKEKGMSYEERKKHYLMFLKQKCDGSIKARECADRRSQREYTTKSETVYLQYCWRQ